MSTSISITVKESAEALQKLLSKAKPYQRPRIKMLQLLLSGITSVNELSRKTKASTASILTWKKGYNAGGIEALIGDKRGGDKRSGISAAEKQQITDKLSDSKNAFRSYGEAQAWFATELGIQKKYHALNKYLKRNFGTKLKVGRKSHVKKDEAAVAVFKKSTRKDQSY